MKMFEQLENAEVNKLVLRKTDNFARFAEDLAKFLKTYSVLHLLDEDCSRAILTTKEMNNLCSILRQSVEEHCQID